MTVSRTSDVLTASLFADEYCGAGTRLIFYVRAGSVVSREFTAKDTHSPHGDLLVVYSKDRTIRDERFAEKTTVLLGFEAPSFTHGTDLILPFRANADLRSSLAAGSKKSDGQQALVPDKVLSKLKNRSDVPQVRYVSSDGIGSTLLVICDECAPLGPSIAEIDSRVDIVRRILASVRVYGGHAHCDSCPVVDRARTNVRLHREILCRYP